MKLLKHSNILLLAAAVCIIILNSCGSKGGSGGGTPPNPCSGVTITVSGTTTNASSGSSNGSISASASGGSGFTFSINGGAFQSTGSFAGLAVGTYSITAKDSRGCTGANSFTITANDPCVSVTFTVSGTSTPSSPCSPFDGTITITTSGGGSGFTYNINGGAFQSSPLFNNLEAKSYTVGAKETGGCIRTASVTVLASFIVSATSTAATPCIATPNGSITITTSGSGTGFTYNINGGAFQSSPTFNTLAANTYTVGARETGGCVKTASVTVTANPAGPLFAAVKTVILANCAISGCHIGSNPAGGFDFTQDCQIVANSGRIKVRAVDNFGTGQQMPQPPAAGLSLTDRNKIVNWINAGGLYSN